MMKNFTLFPLLIVIIFLALSVRLADVFVDVKSFAFETNEAIAASDEDDDGQDGADDNHSDDHADDDDMHADDGGDHADDHMDDDDEHAAQQDKWRDAIEEDFGFEATRRDYAKNLEARRQELESKEKNLKAREALLQATEGELERKYQELNNVRKKLEGLLDQQQEENKAQIVSLVKIYEGMKAKEAAAIFNTLDIDVLFQVMSNMGERKASAILAKMTPERAKTLTVMLAQKRALPENEG